MSLLAHQELLLIPTGTPPTGTLFDLISADLQPGDLYYRHNDTTLPVMINQNGTDGDYVNTPLLNQTPIYSGGPDCFLSGGGSNYGESPTFPTFPTGTSISLVTVVKFNSFLSFNGLVCRDNSVARKWQWRLSTDIMQWIQIVGGVTTTSASIPIVTGTTYILGITIGPNVTPGLSDLKLFINGSIVGTATITEADYGGIGDTLQIGYMGEGGGANSDAFFSESVVFFGATRSPTRMADYATVAGL